MVSRFNQPRLLAIIVALVVCGWLIIALAPNVPGMQIAAAVLGTMFGQVSLAAVWCALGPFALIRRLPLTAAWIAAIVLSFSCAIARSSNPHALQVFLIYGAAISGQWILVQIPMWLFVARYDLRIVGADRAEPHGERRNNQFGIRQVMILTVLVAFVLGAGRILFGGLKAADQPFRDWKAVFFFGYFAFANAAIAFPLIAAALSRRRLVASIAGALLLVALATAVELSLLPTLSGPQNRGMYWTFALINVVQCLWILAVLLLLRAAGFRLTSRRAASPASTAG